MTFLVHNTNAGTQEQLEACRQQIDSLDQRIVELVQERAQVVEKVGKIKREAHHPAESKSLNDIRWLYELMHRVGSLSHARDVAAGHAREAAIVLAGLDWLPRSRHRDMLASLVDYVHGRTR